MTKTKSEWAATFAQASHGHVLWDGTAEDGTDPNLAYTTAFEFVDFSKQFGFFRPGDLIMDIGCGNGRFGIPFSEMKVSYVGTDPMREQIIFCREAFRDYPHLRFYHCDVRNEHFNPDGTVPPEEYQFPALSDSQDNVILYSVCTHLQTLSAAQHYLNESRRVLKKGGKLFVTWYRSPPDAQPTDYVGRTVYTEWDIINMMAGFNIIFTYGGHSGNFYDQWCLFCQKN